MATGTYQAPVTCDLCDTSENVDSFCLTCKGNLCETCKISHAQARIFRNHKVVPILEGLKHRAAEEECMIHPSSIYSMYCDDCNRLVCSECISSGEHRRHDIGKIEAALQRVRREIEEYHDKLENKYLAQCKNEEAKIKQNIAECKKGTVSLKSKINDKRAEMITEIHKLCDDMINKAEDEEKHHTLALQELQDIAKEIESDMTKSTETLRKLASEQIKFNQEKPSLTHFDVPKAPTLHLPTFKPGTLDKMQIRLQIGELLIPQSQQIFGVPGACDVSIIQRNQLEMKIYTLGAIDTHVLVLEKFNTRLLKLLDSGGKETGRLNTKFDISDFAVTASGDIIATDYHCRCIRIMTQTGQVTQTIKTNANKPTGVCLGNNNQEIVVCVNTPDKSSSKLVVYSRDGKEIRTINYTDKPVGRYTDQTVAHTNRGDYCVAHSGHNKVYVLDSNGALRYTYDGSGAGKMAQTFLPYDICSDISNHLFISDHYNHNIQMLDGEGKFLRFILTEDDGITMPTGLCIDKDGRLWVGQMGGGLCIVKYLK